MCLCRYTQYLLITAIHVYNRLKQILSERHFIYTNVTVRVTKLKLSKKKIVLKVVKQKKFHRISNPIEIYSSSRFIIFFYILFGTLSR